MLVRPKVVGWQPKQQAAERDLRGLEEDVNPSSGGQLDHVHVLNLLATGIIRQQMLQGA